MTTPYYTETPLIPLDRESAIERMASKMRYADLAQFDVLYGLDELAAKIDSGGWVRGNYENADWSGVVTQACLIGWVRVIDGRAQSWVKRFLYLAIPDEFRHFPAKVAVATHLISQEPEESLQGVGEIKVDALEADLRSWTPRSLAEGMSAPWWSLVRHEDGLDANIINYNDQEGRTVEEIRELVGRARALAWAVTIRRLTRYSGTEDSILRQYEEWKAAIPKRPLINFDWLVELLEDSKGNLMEVAERSQAILDQRKASFPVRQ